MPTLQAFQMMMNHFRYILMGDAMNTSSRMMSFGDEQCVHISAGVKAELPSTYACKVRCRE